MPLTYLKRDFREDRERGVSDIDVHNYRFPEEIYIMTLDGNRSFKTVIEYDDGAPIPGARFMHEMFDGSNPVDIKSQHRTYVGIARKFGYSETKTIAND